MPPKKAPGASKKTEQKKKEKVIEDKTFGLKNKKGAKQQKFIQQVEKQVKSGGVHPLMNDPLAKKAEKEKKLKEQKDAMLLIAKPVIVQKIEKGADPKSVLCQFFKLGLCTKGDRCKFSHDLTVERKAEKRSLYVDMRDDEKEADTMDGWDEQKLKDVVEKKQGQHKNIPTTDIICKYFLEAVEKSKYGWFWECPSGQKCIYRHALPPGFILKKDKKKDDKKNEISLVDLIERERAALGPKQTKITLETFIAWKKKKLQEKKDQLKKDEDQKRSEFKAGRNVGLSGREMFSFNPDMARDDEDEEGGLALDSSRLQPEEEDEIQYKELELDLITLEATEVDGSGTLAKEDRLKNDPPLTNGHSSAGSRESSPSSPTTTEDDAVPINENLFMDDELDEELQNLDLDK